VELSLWRDHLIQDEGAELLSNGLQIIDAEGVGHHFELLIWKNKKNSARRNPKTKIQL